MCEYANIFIRFSALQNFMSIFFFHSIDATNSERIARYVNDAEDGAELNNSTMKMVMVEGYPRLCLFANREIKMGEEVRYDYGDPNVPWRQVCDNVINFQV